MKKLLVAVSAIAVIWGVGLNANASPQGDLETTRNHFKAKYPKLKRADYGDGVYAIDQERRKAWLEWLDFEPPFSLGLAHGKKLFHGKFANGKTYADCFKNRGHGIRQEFPYFDPEKGKVVTIEGAINECRERNSEKPLDWAKGDMAVISAYMSSTSAGKRVNVKVPNDPRALAIYERGKRHFYAKRGQLNFSCGDCHIHNAGNMVRTDLLSPVIGQTTHFPVWRLAWAKEAEEEGNTGIMRGFGTLQRRYKGCNEQVRAKGFALQSDEYVALEYFHQYLSNGVPINARMLRQ